MHASDFFGNISPPFTCADAMIVDSTAYSAAGRRRAGITTTSTGLVTI